MITLRALSADDIPNLPQIRPTYRSATILQVDRVGSGFEVGWQLIEHALDKPFDKGAGYDFTPEVQDIIRERLTRPDDVHQQVAETNGKLVAFVEVELQAWNNTAALWNLMIDLSYRGQGLGRRLWYRALAFAKESDVRAIVIETQNTNVAACHFYAHMGCHLVGLHDSFYDGSDETALFWLYPIRA